MNQDEVVQYDTRSYNQPHPVHAHYIQFLQSPPLVFQPRVCILYCDPRRGQNLVIVPDASIVL